MTRFLVFQEYPLFCLFWQALWPLRIFLEQLALARPSACPIHGGRQSGPTVLRVFHRILTVQRTGIANGFAEFAGTNDATHDFTGARFR